MTLHAAGIIFATPANQILLCKRSDDGTWGIPGGGIETGETAELAAVRECWEELGICPNGERQLIHNEYYEGRDVSYQTFLQHTDLFDVQLNDEHTEYLWAEQGNYPEPLHPGLASVLNTSFTTDKGFYTVEQLSPKLSMTPEGFLLCEDVPIARIGQLLYTGYETPIAPAQPGGIVTIDRTEGEVFHPDTLASFAGKPVTYDHPVGGPVTPANWSLLSVGTVNNPRRGSDTQKDLMIADLLITDPVAIQDILDKKIREVSCGYDCDYEETGPGRGRQIGIIGNHVALVDKGRAGPRCSIGDTAMALRRTLNTTVAGLARATAYDKLNKAIAAKDKAAADTALAEVLSGDAEPDGGTSELHLHIGGDADGDGGNLEDINDVLGQICARLDDMEGITGDAACESSMKDGRMKDAYRRTRDKRANDRRTRDAEEAEKKEKEEKETADRRMRDAAEGKEPEEEGDDPKAKSAANDRSTVRDSSSLAPSYQETVSRAELLSPGIRFYAYDARADFKLTQDALTTLRRRALAKAFENDDTAPVIRPLTGDKPNFQTMDAAALTSMFNGAAELVRQHNTTRDSRGGGRGVEVHSGSMTFSTGGGALSPAEINKRNQEFWASKK